MQITTLSNLDQCPDQPVALVPLILESLERRLLFSGFVAQIDNPYFPRIPGTSYVYSGTNEDGAVLRIVVNVLHEKREIAGVLCTVSHVQEFADGKRVENTFDWHAQDRAGNVWYFGEDSSELEDDQIVSRAGSWQAGVAGAAAGIVMPANPFVGQSYIQEFAPGVAADEARIAGLEVRTPPGSFGSLLHVVETTPMEPGVLEHKFYARGVGLVLSRGIAGELEDVVLERVRFEPKDATSAAPVTAQKSLSGASQQVFEDSEILTPFTTI